MTLRAPMGISYRFEPNLIHSFCNSFLLLLRPAHAVSAEEVKLLEAMKYGGFLLHWADYSEVDKRGREI